jgi:hypothetical protein
MHKRLKQHTVMLRHAAFGVATAICIHTIPCAYSVAAPAIAAMLSSSGMHYIARYCMHHCHSMHHSAAVGTLCWLTLNIQSCAGGCI